MFRGGIEGRSFLLPHLWWCWPWWWSPALRLCLEELSLLDEELGGGSTDRSDPDPDLDPELLRSVEDLEEEELRGWCGGRRREEEDDDWGGGPPPPLPPDAAAASSAESALLRYRP